MNPSAAFKKLCRLTGQAVHEFKMIQEGDRLLVGISGGVDSMVLMHVLEHLRQHAPIRFELYSITIDEGFDGINHTALSEYARNQNWKHTVRAVPIADQIIQKNAQDKPCPLCSRLRRGFIHGYADEIGSTKIVLGHHRDDLCVSLLMALFRGRGIKTMGPNVEADRKTKRVIRPLCYAPKALIEKAAEQVEFPDVGVCDYSEHLDKDGDRAYLERLLPELEKQFPSLGNSVLHSLKNIREEHLLDSRFLK
jgi:tRNA 2-thiocytidine biosynthesis protein TtcA